MYLKRIIAHGFKSFADKMNFEFESDITGIVGPNGSGKSNVVDAVRWVLGEQSVKSLRGDGTMTDVIFSGSKSRHASNQASITLIFDNTDNYLNTPFTEISIKRQVYKDGTQEYYLNNERCRLKDITNILLDTGIAKESFNIISQGKIEEIINSKPVDRRIIFEEAAGVLKYKKRKEDALRKLARTHENMERVDDIIEELKVQVEPLKEQREKAIIYKQAKDELTNIEISVISKEITTLSTEYKKKKELIISLEEELSSSSSDSSIMASSMEKIKVEITKLDVILSDLQKKLLEAIRNVEKINSQKQILLERKKYQVSDTKLHANLIEIKETLLKEQNELENKSREVELLKKEVNRLQDSTNDINKAIDLEKDKKQKLEQTLTENLRKEVVLKNKIDSLKESIEQNSTVPYSVSKVLSNPTLTGINGTLASLIEVEEKYVTAISTSLGFSTNYIVVDKERDAKEAISYLKREKLGRATFYPIDTIKPAYLSSSLYDSVKNMSGFIDVAANLIKTETKYHDIINFVLGNILVVDNIDNATKISFKINRNKRIVTLDGEVVNVGGSLTGGTKNKTRNIIEDKFELEHLLKEEVINLELVKKSEEKINEIDYNLKSMEDKLYLELKEYHINKDKLAEKEVAYNLINENLEEYRHQETGTKDVLENRLSEEEEELLTRYYEAINIKNELETNIKETEKEKNRYREQLAEEDFKFRRENSLLSSKTKELNKLEIEVNRDDVKLDHLLNTLSETYQITYEKAVLDYPLTMEIEEARDKVSELKRTIRTLGEVNLGAIEEYDRLKVRYEFLEEQKLDLIKAEDILLEIINEMDEVMKKEFQETFKLINENFKVTFKDLFRGGYGELTLTEPDNLLETGIEIVASPPGKKLTSISLLSGGEKTFTAISLLFSILKSRPVPFCILDEVEAALDEVNVASFGEYITKMKDKTQFILITHKKKTMEYVDKLYGITMQESGVSKLVSVTLSDIKK